MTLDDLRGRAVITADELAASGLLPVRRTAIHEACKRGELPSIRVGRRLLIPVPALLSLLGVPPPNVNDPPCGGGGPSEVFDRAGEGAST